jgi:hypothetical protein
LLLTSIFNFLCEFASSDLLSCGQDTNSLVDIEDTIAIEIHCVKERHQHVIGDANAFPLAEIVAPFKLVADLSESVEINLSIVNDTLHNLLLITEEVLESAVLIHVAAALFEFLVLVNVQHVVGDPMEWDVVNVE